MSSASSPDKKSGCGVFNAIFGTRKFWPRRTTSTGSIPTYNGSLNTIESPMKIPSAGHNSKNRRGSFDDLEANNNPGGFKPQQPRIPLAKEQQQYQKNNGRKPTNGTGMAAAPPPAAAASRNNGVRQQHGQGQTQTQTQNTRKTVPKESMGISGELEMMLAENQRNRGSGGNLVRVSSGNVMVHSNLGNLRQSGGTAYTYTKPASSNNKQEYQVGSNNKNDQSRYGVGNIVNNKKVVQQNGGNNKPMVGSSNSLCRALSCRMDPEELKIMGNEDYKNGRFAEALALYERAIDLDPSQASYRSNKSAALTALGRLLEAVFECREAISIEPHYHRAHHRLANLYLRLGEAEKAVHHFKQAGPEADPDAAGKARAILGHLKKCDDAKRLKDWHTVLRETGKAVAAGADSSPMICALQAEAYLKLHRHQEADMTLTNSVSFDVDQCTKFFGPAGNATLLVVKAQVDMAAGRFDDAMEAVQQAGRLDSSNRDLGVVSRRARAVSAARSHGNDLFKEGRFSEACAAYGQGLEHEPNNSVLLCNRAACRIKLSQFEKAIEDCNAALNVRSSYSKARLRRADCNAKLRKWEAAARDYEVLLQESPGDGDVAKALFESQMILKKQRGEDESSLRYGDLGVVKAENSEHFKNLTSWPGLSVAWFLRKPGDKRTQQFMEQLSKKYPTVKFLKVEVDDKQSLMKSESVSSVPVLRVYKSGRNVQTVEGEDLECVESAIKDYIS